MSAPTVQYARTEDDVAIAWVERGEGVPLIVSTGLAAPLDVGWERNGVLTRLSQSFRVVSFDPRGCGLSERGASPGTFDDEAKDIAAIADAIGEPRLALMGHYLGTPSAAIAALNDPERFTQLVLYMPIPISSDGNVPPLGEMTDIWRSTVNGLLRLGWEYHEEPARRALLTMLAPTVPHDTLKRFAQTLYHYVPTERMLSLIDDLPTVNMRQMLNEVQIPTLVCLPPERDPSDDVESSIGRAWSQAFRRTRLLVARDHSPLFMPGSANIEQLARTLEETIAAPKRRIVSDRVTRTILFTDIEGSTSLVDRLGDVHAREITRQVESLTLETIRERDGVVIKTMGDGALAWFSAASSALDVAIVLQSRLAAHGCCRDVHVKIGISAGEPIVESDDLHGATVNQAARITELASGGEILVSGPVRGLLLGRDYRFVDRGMHELKGFRDQIRLFSVGWREPAD